MLFMLIDKGYQLDEVVFYDTGMEFQAIYNTRDAVLPILKKLGIKYTELHPEQPFLWTMFERPVKKRGTNIIHKKGYSWCGGTCRWGTSEKLRALKAHTKLIMSVLLPMRPIVLKRKNDQIGFYHFVIGALLKQMHSSIVTQKALFGMRME